MFVRLVAILALRSSENPATPFTVSARSQNLLVDGQVVLFCNQTVGEDFAVDIKNSN
jgi:hypothetical protein